jgi:hypothetical protein
VARRVFFSFEYRDDVTRAMVVRKSAVTQDKEAAGFVDAAEFEKIKQKGDQAVKNWIGQQLDRTTVTVVLVGSETCASKWVKYEIEQSKERGNGLLGIDISKIKNFNGDTTERCGKIYGLGKMGTTILDPGSKTRRGQLASDRRNAPCRWVRLLRDSKR